MATDKGTLVAIAFDAVKQCHEDVGALLRDLGGEMTRAGWGGLSQSRDAVTHGVSKNLGQAARWMPQWLYRVFKNPKRSGMVDGVNIHFYRDDPVVKEPLLVVGHAEYRTVPGKGVEEMWQRYDVTNAFFEWIKPKPTTADLNKVLTVEKPDERIVRMAVIGVDLYSINSVRAVVDLLVRVGNQDLPRE